MLGLLALFRARRLVTAHIKCGRSTSLPARCFRQDALAQHCVLAILAHTLCTHWSGTECTCANARIFLRIFSQASRSVRACPNLPIPAPPSYPYPHQPHVIAHEALRRGFRWAGWVDVCCRLLQTQHGCQTRFFGTHPRPIPFVRPFGRLCLRHADKESGLG